MNEKYYINLLGSRLEGFTKKGNDLYNFRCPICGDSQTNKSKKRGYIYQKKGKYLFYCQNCGAPGKSFKNFLKLQDPMLYKEYMVSHYKESHQMFGSKPKPAEVKKDVKLSSKKPIFKVKKEDIPDSVYTYIAARHLDVSRFEYTTKFYEYINKLKPGQFAQKMVEKYDHPRLLINFYNEEGTLTIVQGRGLNNEQPKYITIKIDEDAEKLYGLDRLDKSQTIYVVEGVPDAMSIDNAVATCDTNYARSGDTLPKNKIVVIPDTDVRNPQVMRSVEKCVESGLAVCLLPQETGKDLNEMRINGMSKAEIMTLIDKYTYSGLSLKMKFSKWRKDK